MDTTIKPYDVNLCLFFLNRHIPRQGNEGIDVKEGSVDTLIANNEVYMQYDPNSGGGSAQYC